jgi:N-succinyldiaminopimelate aminotransferase
MNDPNTRRGAFRDVPFMGVIWVVHEAMQRGFVNGHPDWSNLGQGQPEVGPMKGAPKRLDQVQINPEDHAYGPLEGIPELRQAIADHYNRIYRKGKRSQYTVANVCVASGGRLALTRAMAALGPVNVGYQVPDYTAYEDMLNVHLARLHTTPLRAQPEDGFVIPAERFAREVDERCLGAYVVSNPCNPTGGLLKGRELAATLEVGRSRGVTLLLDEFYSHFIYTRSGEGASQPVSAARNVEDVNDDPVVIFDGLTKSFRYPGWRVGWVLAPEPMVESMARTSSAIDGGPSRIAQRLAIKALEPSRADKETGALRKVFAEKRREMLRRLRAVGIRFEHDPLGTFYCWGSLADLPAPFNDSMEFFWRALDHKVMTVPGPFFDINPGGYRSGPSPYSQWMRFSFGPPMGNMRMGLKRLERMLGS